MGKKAVMYIINTGWYYAHLFFSSFRPIIWLVVVQLPENVREKSANSEQFSWARNGGKLLKSSLASQTIGHSPEVTLYLYQLWRHIYTNNDVTAIAQSFGTQHLFEDCIVVQYNINMKLIVSAPFFFFFDVRRLLGEWGKISSSVESLLGWEVGHHRIIRIQIQGWTNTVVLAYKPNSSHINLV